MKKNRSKKSRVRVPLKKRLARYYCRICRRLNG